MAAEASHQEGVYGGESRKDRKDGAENGSYSAKHILLKTVDDAGSALSEDEIAQKKAQAEDLLAQLRASNDP